METGTVEWVGADAEQLANLFIPGTTKPRGVDIAGTAKARNVVRVERGQALPPPVAFKPRIVDPLLRGLAALAPFGHDGHDGRRSERFMAAREEGCCYQCHAPLQNLLNDCPCPHWFITSASTIERVAPVLGMYSVADVLHFILLHLVADNAGRPLPRNQVTVATPPGMPALAVRLGRKQWGFRVVAQDGQPSHIRVELFNPRTGKHTSLDLPATDRDLDVMHAVTAAVEHQ